MTLSVTVDDRFVDAAESWGETRMLDLDDALAAKAEQALLEIEHLVADAYEVDFDMDGRTISYDPTDELEAFLETKAEETGLDPGAVLGLYVDLFATAFDDGADERPSNAPPP